MAAVHDGYVLLKSVTWAPLGGALLTECMRRCVDHDGSLIKPRYEFKRVDRGQGQYEVCLVIEIKQFLGIYSFVFFSLIPVCPIYC